VKSLSWNENKGGGTFAAPVEFEGRYVQTGRTVPPLTPEREAARQRLKDGERNMLEEMERELGRLLTEQEEHLALEHTRAQQAPTP
jgi:hypothetical protein